MRVYLPSTLPAVSRAVTSAQLGPAPLGGFAVTPALHAELADGSLEELEYVALTDAARASLRSLADDPAAPRRRVVLVAEVPDADVQDGVDPDNRAAVRIAAPVPLGKVAAGHIDDPDAADDVRAAVDALPAADAGDENAAPLLDRTDDHELMWYATQELRYLD